MSYFILFIVQDFSNIESHIYHLAQFHITLISLEIFILLFICKNLFVCLEHLFYCAWCINHYDI